MKLSKWIDTALKSYRESPLFSAENKEYLEKDDGRLVSKVAKLEEALEFYAAPINYTISAEDSVFYDSGARAREALKEIE